MSVETISRRRSFVQIPDALVSDVRLSSHAVRVWARLDKYAGADGRAFPSRQTLANDLGISDSTVKRALQELAQAGWITRSPRPDGQSWDTALNEQPGSPVTRPRVTRDPTLGSPVTRIRRPTEGDPTTSHSAGGAAAPDEVLDLDLEEPEPAQPNPVQVLVGAYVDRVRGKASKSLLGAVGKTVKRLLVVDGFEPALILAAIEEAAPKGQRDLDRIIAAPGGPGARFERTAERQRMFARWDEIATEYGGVR